MQQHFSHIESLHDIGAILLYSSDICGEQGAIRRSYHLTPQFDAPNSMRSVVYAHGFAQDWLDRYDKSGFRQSDPIPERTMRHGAMLTWAAAREAGPNSPANKYYFAAMEEAGLIHGIGLPLFGPRGRDAYSGIDFGRPIDEVPNRNVGIVRAVLQAAHQRVCVILDSMNTMPELSEREREVLEWAARGKSISSIATILNLSSDTVKTYTKRVYAKLGASDRVGATVTALKLGLVRI